MVNMMSVLVNRWLVDGMLMVERGRKRCINVVAGGDFLLGNSKMMVLTSPPAPLLRRGELDWVSDHGLSNLTDHFPFLARIKTTYLALRRRSLKRDGNK